MSEDLLRELELGLSAALERVRALRAAETPALGVRAESAESAPSTVPALRAPSEDAAWGSQASETSRRSDREATSLPRVDKVAEVWDYNDRHSELARCADESLVLMKRRGRTWRVTPSAEVLEEHTRSCRVPVLSPTSPVRLVSDLSGIVAFALDVTFGPLQVFYSHGEAQHSAFGRGLAWFPFITMVFWTVNLPIGFISSYYDSKGHLENRPRCVAMHYVRTWFLHDVALVILDWVSVLSTSLDVQATSALRAFRFLRVLRAFRVNRDTAAVTQRLNRGSGTLLVALRVFKYFLTMLLLVHLAGCGWYAIGASFVENPYNWLDEYRVRERTVHFHILSSWHWALAQFGPTKMNHVPTNEAERAFAVVVAVVAMVVNPFIVSRITSSMVALENLRREKSLQAQHLAAYLQRHKVSDDLRMRIRNFPGVTQNENAVFKVLRRLPVDLMVRLKVEIMSPLMRRHALLRMAVTGRLTGAAEITLASDGADDRVLWGGQKLFSVGQEAQHMHFVLCGAVSYQMKEFRGAMEGGSFCATQTEEVTEGLWLSEHALWLSSWHHLGVAVAGQGAAVEVLSLSASVFQRAFGDNLVLKRYAWSFVDAVRGELFSDVGQPEWAERLLTCWCRSAVRRSSSEDRSMTRTAEGSDGSSEGSDRSPPEASEGRRGADELSLDAARDELQEASAQAQLLEAAARVIAERAIRCSPATDGSPQV